MRRERVSRKMPNHKDSCVLCSRLGRSMELSKLNSYKVKILYVLVYARIHICVYNYMHMLVDAHYIFE